MTRLGFKAFVLTLFAGAAFLVAPSNTLAKEDKAKATGPELYFYPAQAWNVYPSPVAQVSTGAKSCTISNEFNNGFHMELSGSTAGMEMLSVNFIQPAFDEGQVYGVSLSVPGSINKQLSGQAPRSEVLTINMQGQTDLYSAMRSASVLDLSLMDNVFRFYMTGFADSMKRFDKCIGGSITTIPEAAPVKEAAAPVQEETLEAPAPAAIEEVVAAKEEMVEEKFAASETPAKSTDEKVIIDLTQPPAFEPGTSFEDLPKPTAQSETAVSARNTAHNISEDVYEMPFEAQAMEASVKGSKDAPKIEIAEVDDAAEKASAPLLASSSVSSDVSGSLSKRPSPGGYKRLSERLAEEMGSLAPPTTPSASAPGRSAPAAAPTPIAASAITSAAAPSEVEDDIEIAFIPDAEPAKQTDKPTPVPFAEPEVKPAPKPEPAPEKEAETAKMEEIPLETITFNQPRPSTKKVKNHKTPDMKVSHARIKMDTDITKLGDVEPSTSGDEPFSSSRPFADTNMRDKVSEMEKMIRELNQENSKLEGELEGALKESEQEHASVSSENWNLERATMRYNEAERQIDRLGKQLQRERAACTQDTSKLENMLFDPEVTNSQQIARLTALEREIEAAKAEQEEQRSQYEARIRTLQEQLKTQ